MAAGAAWVLISAGQYAAAQESQKPAHADARIDQVFGLVDPSSTGSGGRLAQKGPRGDVRHATVVSAAERLAAAATDLVVNGIRFPRPKPSPLDIAAEPLALMPMGGPLELVAGAPAPADMRQPEAAAADAPAKAPELVAAPAGAPCIAPAEASDADGDLKRNAGILGRPGMCITEKTFKERKRNWTIHTVASGRPGPLWVVVHDDEGESFDTAAHGLQTYGGTLFAVEADGKRNEDGVDPNRNFADDGLTCKKMDGEASPVFTGVLRALFQPGQPLIAVHNSPEDDIPTGGRGHATVSSPSRGVKVVPSENAKSDLASDYDLVLLAAAAPDRLQAEARAKALAQRGVNVVIESISKATYDCSLSNYAALIGNTNYFNVTVDHGEQDKQRRIVDLIMASFFSGVPSQ